MAQPTAKLNDDQICARCMQPVANSDARCRNCGTPRVRTRRVVLWLGIGGVVALFFVVLLMVKVIHDADINAAPPEDPNFEQNTTPTQQPAQPDKPPPLNK